MLTCLFSTILVTAIGLAIGTAAPAHAADDIEAKVQLCAACHGQNGVPTDPKTIPIIWGQQASYIFKQLRDYRNGERSGPIMVSIAKDIKEEDLRGISAYFATKNWPTSNTAPVSAPLPKGVTQCQPCHQPNFEGGLPAPRLAGLSYEYLVESMHAFATDQRTNNGDMPKFMQMLTEPEREAIARYLSAM